MITNMENERENFGGFFEKTIAKTIDDVFSEYHKSELTLTQKEWITISLAPYWVFKYIAASNGEIDERERKAFEKYIKTNIKKADFHFVLHSLRLLEEYLPEIEKSQAEHGHEHNALEEIAYIVELIESRVEDNKVIAFKHTMLLLAWTLADAVAEKNNIMFNISKAEKDAFEELEKVFNCRFEDIKNPPGRLKKFFKTLRKKS